MSRLPRPIPPIAVKLRVVLRQLGTFPELIDTLVEGATKGRQLGDEVAANLFVLACTLACPVNSLQLDHDPALENREKLVELPNGRRKRVVVVPDGAIVLRYYPDANDPEHLFYRPHGAEFAGSHDVKTRVRGDHGQLSDNALAKKERRRLRKLDPRRRRAKIANRKRPWPKRKLATRHKIKG